MLDFVASFSRDWRRVPPDKQSLERIVRKTQLWFEANARDLPWRRTRNPYAIWVSEVMLQQTQVKTVVPYWERWMLLFPNIESLAAAPEEQVLKAWEGLGYYSRARNLQKAARRICSEHGGEFPRLYEEVLGLPGVGRYTAGAICSIAFGEATPILDGNVARVLSRLFTISGPVKYVRTQKKLWGLSDTLVKASSNCSALNQGLMELGATVCLPRAPACGSCPLKTDCKARCEQRVDRFPLPSKAIEMRKRQFLAFIIRRNGHLLVRKRSVDAINAGLWEFPNVEVKNQKDIESILASFGIDTAPIKTIKHTITRNRITMQAFAPTAKGNDRTLARRFGSEWRPMSQLQDLPFSSAHAKLRNYLADGDEKQKAGGPA
jgi:A/G-specific adenine glycosylase